MFGATTAPAETVIRETLARNIMASTGQIVKTGVK
jgi:hypothetical protein